MLKPWRAEPDHTALFLQRYASLVAQARGVLKLSREQATELVHEAFVQFVRHQPDLNAIDELDAYLFGMLRKLHVSNLRRAARQRTLSIADYDSAAIGLRDASGAAELSALQELAQVCVYCASRRHTSRTGSVLALRYFYGRPPTALAAMMRVNVPTVSQWLHLARREAREYLADPELHAAPGPALLPPRVSLTLPADARLAAFITWLRQHPAGRCLTRDDIDALRTSTPLDRETLAHVISCADCLSTVEKLRPGRHPSGPASGEAFASIDEVVKPSRDRLIELHAHRPSLLCVHVNGFSIGSHRLTSGVTEFTTRVRLDEPIEFVEVLSEQGLRLAFIELSDLGRPALARLRLDDDRSLDVAIDISEPWPAIMVRYLDPHFEAIELSADTSIEDDPPIGMRGRVVDDCGRWYELRLPRWSWPALVWKMAILLFIAWVATSPSQAAEVASRMWHYAASAVQQLLGTRNLPGRSASPGAVWLTPTVAPNRPGRAPDAAGGETSTTTDVDALEMHLLARVDSVGGLLGDEVALERIVDRGRARIAVRAIVADAERRRTILDALGSDARSGAVQLAVATVAEALATAPMPVGEVNAASVRIGQPANARIPAYEDVRAALLRRLAPLSESNIAAQVHQFSMGALDLSLQARLHARAAAALVDRVADRWPSLPQALKRQWAVLVIAHVTRVAEETRALELMLVPVFEWPEPVDVAEQPAAASERAFGDLAALARQLAAIATEHDRAVGRALALSTEAPDGLAAASRDFRDSLRQAERLSQSLASMVEHVGGR